MERIPSDGGSRSSEERKGDRKAPVEHPSMDYCWDRSIDRSGKSEIFRSILLILDKRIHRSEVVRYKKVNNDHKVKLN